MHPILSHRERLPLYVGSWCALGLLLVPVLAPARFSWTDAALVLFPPLVFYALVSLSAWYLCRSLPATSTPPIRLVSAGLLSGFIASAFFLAVTLSWTWFLRTVTERPLSLDMAEIRILTAAGMLLYVIALVFHYLMAAVEDSRGAERRSYESQLHARDSELKALRAQINPHFLFNSLNSISALTSSDPQRARSMTVELAEFFRTSVAAGRQTLVPLHDEIALARRYLEIERIRFGDRLRLNIESDPEAADCRVPPLILQPLVENAVKHGIAAVLDGGTIVIRTSRQGTSLSLEVSNPVDGDSVQSAPGTSTGLDSVRERLHIATHDRSELFIERTGSTHTVHLRLPSDL